MKPGESAKHSSPKAPSDFRQGTERIDKNERALDFGASGRAPKDSRGRRIGRNQIVVSGICFTRGFRAPEVMRHLDGGRVGLVCSPEEFRREV
jgi:hypothetical protein